MASCHREENFLNDGVLRAAYAVLHNYTSSGSTDSSCVTISRLNVIMTSIVDSFEVINDSSEPEAQVDQGNSPGEPCSEPKRRLSRSGWICFVSALQI